MTVFFRRSVFCMLPLAAAVMLAMHNEVVSHDTAQTGDSEARTRKSGEIKTLDQVRQLGTLETDSSFFLLDIGEIGSLNAEHSPDQRKAALKKIEEAKAKLKTNEDRSKVESLLRAALVEYFIADMRHRVQELDEIKAKLAESESKLQRRLHSQQESVDLQLKIILREADGAGFFNAEDVTNSLGSGASSSTNEQFLPGQSTHPGGFNTQAGGVTGLANREKVSVAAELQPLTNVLANTQTLVLVVDDGLWKHYRLPSSFDDLSYKQLAGAILKALGSEANSENLLQDKTATELHVRFTAERYEQFGENIPGVIEVLKNASDARKKQTTEAVTQGLLEND